jgi:hypothetical protein
MLLRLFANKASLANAAVGLMRLGNGAGLLKWRLKTLTTATASPSAGQ